MSLGCLFTTFKSCVDGSVGHCASRLIRQGQVIRLLKSKGSSRSTALSSPFVTRSMTSCTRRSSRSPLDLWKKQIQKAIKDSITTGMEYVDSQLVGVRNRMASAKVTEGESRRQVLKNVCFLGSCLFCSVADWLQLFAKRDETLAPSISSGRHSQFKVVHNATDESQI